MVNVARGVDRGRLRPTNDDDFAEHGGYIPANRSTEACSHGLQHTYLLLDNVMVN